MIETPLALFNMLALAADARRIRKRGSPAS